MKNKIVVLFICVLAITSFNNNAGTFISSKLQFSLPFLAQETKASVTTDLCNKFVNIIPSSRYVILTEILKSSVYQTGNRLNVDLLAKRKIFYKNKKNRHTKRWSKEKSIRSSTSTKQLNPEQPNKTA
ncbi:hypothetical protein [Colwellia hornerae]|uniref:Uncharacterized protein n=1 Tax=Colwellia hornerae TaxID=89402 RepID=A0A5C6Q3I5_9GAMM|nr:hypothetical protein [Colwellia hornerae]TWX52168.1 hypothetical protein ESZ28_13095 [Colwellia hornerae]TWX57517.1 hypothetical protein ESZ26_13060 [Colwellia hornerae]TWX63380.1 hypothetical protein ESZ27_17005 [Colwellia hornerae]